MIKWIVRSWPEADFTPAGRPFFKAYSSFKFETKMNFKFDAKMNGLKFAIEVTGEKHRRLRSGRALSTHKFSAREADV